MNFGLVVMVLAGVKNVCLNCQEFQRLTNKTNLIHFFSVVVPVPKKGLEFCTYANAINPNGLWNEFFLRF